MKRLITLMSLAVVGLSFGQEEEPKFNISGSVDAYYRANLSAPNDEDAIGAPSVFANDPAFSLGMANVTFSYEGEKVGFVADLAYGPRADEYNGEGSVINEAYMYWNASDKVTLMMGRFNSWMGVERFSPVDNFNYSMSHMFSFSARNFNGIAAQFDLGNDFGLGFGVMNPVNVTTGNNSGDYSVAAGISKGKTGVSFVTSQDATFIDVTTAFDITDNFSLGLNAHMADYEDSMSATGPGTGFTSISAYPQIKSSDKLSWGMRLEYITIDNFVADELSVLTPTFTANYSVGDLTIKPELRIDTASEDIFINNDGEAAGGLSSFVLGAVYKF